MPHVSDASGVTACFFEPFFGMYRFTSEAAVPTGLTKKQRGGRMGFYAHFYGGFYFVHTNKEIRKE